jgi:hypothetical protein
MAVPNVGQAISALCCKIGAADLKIESLFARAETILASIMSAKDQVSQKIKKIQMSIEKAKNVEAAIKNGQLQQLALQQEAQALQTMPQQFVPVQMVGANVSNMQQVNQTQSLQQMVPQQIVPIQMAGPTASSMQQVNVGQNLQQMVPIQNLQPMVPQQYNVAQQMNSGASNIMGG